MTEIQSNTAVGKTDRLPHEAVGQIPVKGLAKPRPVTTKPQPTEFAPTFTEAVQEAIGSPQLPKTLNVFTEINALQTMLEQDVSLLEEELRIPLVAILEEEQKRIECLVILLQGQSV